MVEKRDRHLEKGRSICSNIEAFNGYSSILDGQGIGTKEESHVTAQTQKSEWENISVRMG